MTTGTAGQGTVILAFNPNPLSAIKGAITGSVDAYFSSMGTAFCGMAADLSSSVFSFAQQKTSIDLNADYVVENYNIAFGIAVLVVTGLFLCACIMGAVRGDPHIFVRAVASTGTAILGSFIALALLQMILTASDGIADAFGNGKPLGASLVAQLRALPEQGNFALDLVLSLLVAMFSFALFVVLYIRKVAIIVMAVFIPLYLAGQPTMSTSAWIKRATEILLALIFAKPVIYAIFTLGAGMASDSTGSTVDQTLTILSGTVVMIAAVFAPFVLMHLMGFADVHLMRAVGSVGRRSAASFGQGAGALLGSTSRETFRGIGARLQTRNRGMLGDSGGAIGVEPGLARPAAIRTGRSIGAPVGMPSRPGAATAAVRGPSTGRPRPARVGAPGGGGTSGVAARQPARSTAPARATVAVGAGTRSAGGTRVAPARTGGGAGGGAGRSGQATTTSGRPPVTPAVRPPRVVAPKPPTRTGGK
ncbi:conserved membrane hypothetical protein [Frankia canadensis]|uniref:TrbL/VirB6 plasmid conjugal transfer protein n=1 Tax=Frankia canadensis TaxID=1836972 RepID=A0A2I2L0E5_9ACTN|nr:hypothetical protein [Frankia canadensis]SNQ51396.1 conserved membrane hypothetical protein [Frankia canadensis]SOU58686.1 conserved membrane hypothetical protein [Frankia canadensis]